MKNESKAKRDVVRLVLGDNSETMLPKLTEIFRKLKSELPDMILTWDAPPDHKGVSVTAHTKGWLPECLAEALYLGVRTKIGNGAATTDDREKTVERRLANIGDEGERLGKGGAWKAEREATGSIKVKAANAERLRSAQVMATAMGITVEKALEMLGGLLEE